MAKIAVELRQALALRERNGSPGGITPRLVAQGDGWTVRDVVCTSGPQDTPFEELHNHVAIAMVVAGNFGYRCRTGHEVMTPGSLLLGNAGDCFECGHEHGAGDRCISFQYHPDYFEDLIEPVAGARIRFSVPRVPPIRELSPLITQACSSLAGASHELWEELSLLVAAQAAALASGMARATGESAPGATARVARILRHIESEPDRVFSLQQMASEARLSPYHFLRSFQRITGLTPHQYVLRARLREAALRLADDNGPAGKILDIAFDCGFGDVSNFNRAFRGEFGVNPREYRKKAARRQSQSVLATWGAGC